MGPAEAVFAPCTARDARIADYATDRCGGRGPADYSACHRRRTLNLS